MSDETLNPELLDSLGQPQEPAAEGTQNLPGSPTSVHYVFGEDNDHIEPELKARFEEILEALRDVIDPELGINIVDLGLVYGIPLDGDFALLDLTLTSAGCPLTDMIEQQCRFVIGDLVQTTSINWVWLPPWGPDKITDDGREQLRALGFNV